MRSHGRRPVIPLRSSRAPSRRSGARSSCRRRCSAESGSIFVKVDRLDGRASLYGPAPQALVEEGRGERLFAAIVTDVPAADVEERMRRELRFDQDLWLVEIEDRAGRHFLALAAEEGSSGSRSI